MDIRLTWEEFRDSVDNHELSIKYIQKDGNYYLFVIKESVQFVCVLQIENSEEFVQNYKLNSISIL